MDRFDARLACTKQPSVNHSQDMQSTIANAIRYPKLASELLKMARYDQEMRARAMPGSPEWDSGLDVKNAERLSEIIVEVGWPTQSKVGSEASHAAWLIAQHADLEFQKHALQLMKNCPVSEVNVQDVAFLEDRVLIQNGQPQIYGTQWRLVGGTVELFPIANEAEVNQRRAKIGLPPL